MKRCVIGLVYITYSRLPTFGCPKIVHLEGPGRRAIGLRPRRRASPSPVVLVEGLPKKSCFGKITGGGGVAKNTLRRTRINILVLPDSKLELTLWNWSSPMSRTNPRSPLYINIRHKKSSHELLQKRKKKHPEVLCLFVRLLSINLMSSPHQVDVATSCEVTNFLILYPPAVSKIYTNHGQDKQTI